MRAQFKRGPDMRDESGFYNYNGRSYPSVTTILGPYSDFLHVHRKWMAEEVARLATLAANGEAAERWVQKAPDEGWSDSEWIKESCNPLELLMDADCIASAGLRRMKMYSDRGSVLHDLLEDYAHGAEFGPDDLHAAVEEHVYGKERSCTPEFCIAHAEGLLKFLNDFKPTILMSEMPVFSDEFEYAGRFDSVMDLNGHILVVDLKCSKSFKRQYMAQSGAYARTLFGVIDDGIECQMPTGLDCAVLLVYDGKYSLRGPFDPEPPFRQFFLPALTAFNASRLLKLPPRSATWKAQETAA